MNSAVALTESPVVVSHSDLDYFNEAEILSDYEGGYWENVYPNTLADAPMLEFEIQGAKTEVTGHVIDTRNIFLELQVEIKKLNNAFNIRPSDVNNLLHSLFSNVEVSLNGNLVSTSNSLYPHKAYLETEMSHNSETKVGLFASQGYSFESEPSTFTGIGKGPRRTNLKLEGDDLVEEAGETIDLPNVFDVRSMELDEDASSFLYGNLWDIFLMGIGNYILPGVEMRIRLYRSPNDFVLIDRASRDGASNSFALRINKATLKVHKLELKTPKFLEIEGKLKRKAAKFEYKEVVPHSFLVPPGVFVYHKDDLFNRAPIDRIAIALISEKSFAGSTGTNPFHLKSFNMGTLTLKREGVPVGGTPLDVYTTLKPVYDNTLRSLGLYKDGNGITLTDYPDHFCMVFQLTSDLDSFDDTIRPELTGARLSLEIQFRLPVREALRLIVLGERRSTVFIDHNRQVIKNSVVYNG